MAIGNAIERQGYVYVYDEKGTKLWSRSYSQNDGKSGLKGYTSGTVNIQEDNYIFSYDIKGNKVSSRLA